VKKIAARGPRAVVIGDDDPTLTPHAGLVLVAELDRVLGIASVIDSQVGAIKARRQGLGAGGLVLAVAEMMLAGGDFMCSLDVQRQDVAGRQLRAVPEVPSSPTFIALAKRFDEATFGGFEAANRLLVERWFAAMGTQRSAALAGVRPTLDLDPTDVEVYGRRKQAVAYNHAGQLVGRPHPVVWAEAGVVLAADLGDGRCDPRPQALGLIGRAVAALPDGLERPVVRADSGLFDAKVAAAAVAAGCDFAIVAKRSPATWTAARAIPNDAWRPAVGMAGAEVAFCGYRPAGWPAGTRCVVRRVRVEAAEISGDGRSRRRRTIDPNQLALVLDGQAGCAWTYSFICTNLSWHPVGHGTAAPALGLPGGQPHLDVGRAVRDEHLGLGAVARTHRHRRPGAWQTAPTRAHQPGRSGHPPWPAHRLAVHARHWKPEHRNRRVPPTLGRWPSRRSPSSGPLMPPRQTASSTRSTGLSWNPSRYPTTTRKSG
jgi:Transposase DDE domain group 1